MPDSRSLLRAAFRLLLDLPGSRRIGRALPNLLRRPVARLARGVKTWDPRVRALSDDVGARLLDSSHRETALWERIRTRSDWEAFRDSRLQALRELLGLLPNPRRCEPRVSGTLAGEGYAIDNIVFEGRPGLLVTANLYRPCHPLTNMPGILICHGHHRPKAQAELQQMGMTWARQGSTVLVMDQLCHGERAQHPFRDAIDFNAPFRLERQDYFFRYTVGMQLDLIGESLIGWMVGDLIRGVDLLAGLPGVDASRIILIGAVAGGGNTAAITAALDGRIAAVVPFGFGKAHGSFAGSGSWESTRNLRLSARDGFAPWLILGAVAPRRLVYAHEFAWDAGNDPVWARLRTVYGLYGALERLEAVHGSGSVRGRSATDTHCTNVGPIHRRQIDRILEGWFGMPAPQEERTHRYTAEELTCLTPELDDRELRPVHRLARELGDARSAAARRQLATLEPGPRRIRLRNEFGRLLGDVGPATDWRVMRTIEDTADGTARLRIVLQVERGIAVPMVLLIPAPEKGAPRPVVVGLAQEGGQRLLAGRSELIGELLRGGVAVCLPDLRGLGDAERGEDRRGRRSLVTAVSSSEQMLGQTLLGSRLRDLRTVLSHLRTRSDLDAARVGLWGDSFAPHNRPDQNLAVPFDVEPYPELCEPLGGLLALLGGLLEPGIRTIYSCGGLIGYASLLDSPFCYVPHDAIVAGALTAGDLSDVAAALAPRPLRMEALVDGCNRRVSPEDLAETFAPVRAAYHVADAAEEFHVEIERNPATDIARWIVTRLRACDE